MPKFLVCMYKHVLMVVAGGSISGLCCPALGGCSVLVIEDDAEVGTPDHCGGMVSVSALQRLQT